MYIDLLKKCLLNLPYLSDEVWQHGPDVSLQNRFNGDDWPPTAHTMVGWKRLTNLEQCVESVIRDGINGDLIETGVWRGGCCILMQGILKARGEDVNRKVFIADSFCGVPKPELPQDAGIGLHAEPYLSVTLEQVKSNFAKYDLLGGNVVFMPGLFKDTLPTLDPIQKFSVIRLDGDLYQSTMDSLVNLYPKLSVGGYLISDDYYNIEASAAALNDYRKQHGIAEDIIKIDDHGVFWRKQ